MTCSPAPAIRRRKKQIIDDSQFSEDESILPLPSPLQASLSPQSQDVSQISSPGVLERNISVTTFCCDNIGVSKPPLLSLPTLNQDLGHDSLLPHKGFASSTPELQGGFFPDFCPPMSDEPSPIPVKDVPSATAQFSGSSSIIILL